MDEARTLTWRGFLRPGGLRRAIDRDDRHAELLFSLLGDSLDVVALQGRDADVVDEHRRRLVGLDCLPDRLVEALFAAPHDHVHVGEIGGHADAIGVGTGGPRAAIVPGGASAADRAVDDMGDIGDGKQRVARAVETAAALGGAGRGFCATGLALLVVGAGRLVHQRRDFFGLHAILRGMLVENAVARHGPSARRPANSSENLGKSRLFRLCLRGGSGRHGAKWRRLRRIRTFM
jgi:hypothetical protein